MSNLHEAETIAAPLDLTAGQLIKNRYRIVRRLGGGGFGAVYLTEDVALGNRRAVVKFLHREMLANPTARMKFDDEKMALVRLSERRHPGIGDIYDSGALPDGTPFLAMAFIPGVTLADRLAELGQAGKTLSPAEVAAIIEQLGDALATAHEVGVIHRDIKPGNVMLAPQSTGRERVVLIDFGIARLTGLAESDPSRPATGMMATIPYAAPEQLCASRDISPACDVYAFAALTFELLTGRRPFPDVGLGEVLEQRRRGLTERASALRRDIPPVADDLLAAGLSYEPAERPGDIRLFSRQLAAVLRQSRATVPQADPDAQTAVIEPAETDAARPSAPRPAPSLPTTLPAGVPKPGVTDQIERLKAERGNVVRPKRRGLLLPIIAGALGLVVALGLGRLFLAPRSDSSRPQPVTPAPPVAQRGFTYAIQVQKMRDGKPYGEPFWGNGREIFETGYKFQLEIAPDAAGDLYVFADGKDAAGKPELNILFPTPQRDNGAAAVNAGQAAQTGWNTFSGATGNETLFVILTSAGPKILEQARENCFANAGALRSAALEKELRDFLARAIANTPPVAYVEDERRPFGKARGNGETVACRLELKHR